jgi:hypothetical protein
MINVATSSAFVFIDVPARYSSSVVKAACLPDTSYIQAAPCFLDKIISLKFTG